MVYIITKSEERKKREEDVLRTYHYSVSDASPQIREYAEGAAEGIRKAKEALGKK